MSDAREWLDHCRYQGEDSITRESAATIAAFIANLSVQNAELQDQRDAALRECAEYARQAGLAQGKLEGSEAAGVVESWRERAKAAEAEAASLRQALAAARGALEQLDKAADQFAYLADNPPKPARGGLPGVTHHLWALGCAKAAEPLRAALAAAPPQPLGGEER